MQAPLPGTPASQRTPLLRREASLEACTERGALATVAAAYSGGGAAGRLAAAALGGGQRQWQLLSSFLRWAAGAQHLKVETCQLHLTQGVVVRALKALMALPLTFLPLSAALQGGTRFLHLMKSMAERLAVILSFYIVDIIDMTVDIVDMTKYKLPALTICICTLTELTLPT